MNLEFFKYNGANAKENLLENKRKIKKYIWNKKLFKKF